MSLRPTIPHAIPIQPNPTPTRNPQDSNNQTSNHETHPRELHAKLLGRRAWPGFETTHPATRQHTRHHRCEGRRRDRRARAGFEIDHSERSSRVAISRAAGPSGARNTRGATSNTINWAGRRPQHRRRAGGQAARRPEICRGEQATTAGITRPRGGRPHA